MSALKNKVPIALISIFIVFLFLSAGSDNSHLVLTRVIIGITAFFSLLIFSFDSFKRWPVSPSLIVFFLFIGFQAIRAVLTSAHSINPAPDFPELLKNYRTAPAYWGYLALCFALGYYAFRQRAATRTVLGLMTFCGFMMALNMIPSHLIGENISLFMANGSPVFFPAFLYFHKFVSQFILTEYGHQNMTGDLIAFGFFPALTFVIYGFYQWMELFGAKNADASSQRAEKMRVLNSLLLRIVSMMVTASAILLIFSRGTIIFWGLATLFFFLIVMIKKPKILEISFMAFLLIGGFVFACWAGNLKEAWKEVQTIKEEEKALQIKYDEAVYKSRSLYTNIEGAKRAKAIFKDHRLWGVGTNGYEKVSVKYSTPGSEDIVLAKFRACNHYLQLLAEEGMGAFIYFLLLAGYLCEVLWGLFRTQSRFKFLAALAFFCPVFTVLGHASINHLMQQYNLSMFVCLCMGASLAVLRKDFVLDESTASKKPA